MLTKEFIADKTVIQTAPLLFTGIVDEDISADFTLYLLQESEEKFVVYAPTYYNTDTRSRLSQQATYDLASDIHAEFATLEEAQIFFTRITAPLATPLDLHDLNGGFMLTPFDMEANAYESTFDVKATLSKYLVSHGRQQILFRIFLVKNSIIINKRMSISYETNEAAFATYIKIAKYFKDAEMLNLMSFERNLDIHGMFDVFLREQFPTLRQIDTLKDDFGRYAKYAVKALNGNLQLTIHYALVNGLLQGKEIQWSVALYDATTKIFYVRENHRESQRELEELVQRVFEQFSAAGTARLVNERKEME